MFRNKSGLFFDPDPDPAAGDPPPAKDANVSVDKATYDKLMAEAGQVEGLKADIESGKKQLEGLNQNWEATKSLLNSSTEPAAREQNLRHVMTSAGYSPEQITEYLASQSPKPTQDPVEGGEKDPLEDPRIDDLTKQMKHQQDQLATQRQGQMKEMLNRSTATSLDNSKDLGSILSALKGREEDEAKGIEVSDKAKSQILGEIERETLSRLQSRRAQTGQWNDSWFDEESVKAAETVFDRYRTVIGDPSMLGRAPETVSGTERLLKTKPVPAPEWVSGKEVGAMQKEARDFTTDTFLRMAAETTAGAGSKV